MSAMCHHDPADGGIGKEARTARPWRRTRVRTDHAAAAGRHRTGAPPDPREPVVRLLRDLSSRPVGLSEREAGRRLERYGPNSLVARTTRTWPRALARQFTQPLAVLLMLAAVLSVVAGTPQLAWAIMAVVLLNALFAFVQERQAGRAVEALGRYLPPLAQVRRNGEIRSVAATEVVPATPRAGRGRPGRRRRPPAVRAVEIDASALSGESAPVERVADAVVRGPRVRRRAAGGERSGRPAADDHPRARRGGPIDGEARRAGETALRGRDPRFDRHLHRQDRHPDST